MVDKSITLDELRKLEESGAEIEIEHHETQIAQFGDLIKALQTMVANEEERVRADLARNQTQLEILATLQSMIRKQGSGPAAQPVDLSPIRDLLEDIRAERHAEPVDYDFNIIRPGGDGYQPASKIEARAIKPTTH